MPLYNLMEDAATAEISRAQLWQWVHHKDGRLDDGRDVTVELFRSMMAEEMEKIKAELGEEHYRQGNYVRAAGLFDDIIADDKLADFLTLKAYDHLDG